MFNKRRYGEKPTQSQSLVIPRQPGSPLQTSPAQVLTGAYSDKAVEEMAAEAGRAELYTDTWGESNREPREIHIVNQAAVTADCLISHQAEAELASREDALERLHPEATIVQDRVLDDIKSVETNGDELASVKEKCRQADLHVPEHHWRRMTAEIFGFVLLAVGDLYFVSTTFEVFGLSDKPLLGFLPVSALSVAASSVVIAMLLLTRLAGHLVRRIGQLIEETKAAQQQGATNATQLANKVVRSKFLIGAASVSVFGAFITLYGLSEVRASFLKQEGINAHQSYFLMIQAGVACAGLVLAYWMAHPLDAEWRSACHHYRVAVGSLTISYAQLADIVGRFNGMLRQRDAALIQFCNWTQAATSDAIRQDHLVARRIPLALPEPVQQQLLPDQLPEPPDPALAAVITDHLGGKPTYLKAYQPLSMERVEKRLRKLDKRRNQQGIESHNHLINLLSKTRDAGLVGASTNGNGKQP